MTSMRLLSLEINGFKSFAKKISLEFGSSIVCIVGPNGSGKSNVVEAFRFVLGEQSMKSMRGRAGTDLIFKGSKSLAKGSRASVIIHFDNKDRVFKLFSDDGSDLNLNFDVISIGREVYPDGVNKYLLNGEEVRLKDIHALLASLNIGSSGHHIISQGEADRILNANMRERKEMIEDALGLKIYQYKIREAERKLERATNNMKEVGLLRRENAPHLAFLKRQVEKFQKMKEMKGELLSFYIKYLHTEDIYLHTEEENINGEMSKLKIEIENLNQSISLKESDGTALENTKLAELRSKETEVSSLQRVRNDLVRKLGRVEGMLEAENLRSDVKVENVVLSSEEVSSVLNEVKSSLEEALKTENLQEVREILQRIKTIITTLEKKTTSIEDTSRETQRELENIKHEVLLEIENLSKKEEDFVRQVEVLKKEINELVEKSRTEERAKFELKVRHQELVSAFELLKVRADNTKIALESLAEEIREGEVLVGVEINKYKEATFDSQISKEEKEEIKHQIDRLKIKLEDAGLGSEADIMKEFTEVSERDNFLIKELEDLEQSIEGLEVLMAELKAKVEVQFKEGIKKINKEFNEFFVLMFGGGSSGISMVEDTKRKNKEEDEEGEDIEEDVKPEQGVEISVSLPHKKVKELQSLSGGERSLTSIALLFAMSQVNPPPFLILDETDAALDEANSRKYGDMLERLSKHSELIVVTHNRETMSRAGVLYGVTIGSDGSSKLLSVRFEEAVQIAK